MIDKTGTAHRAFTDVVFKEVGGAAAVHACNRSSSSHSAGGRSLFSLADMQESGEADEESSVDVA